MIRMIQIDLRPNWLIIMGFIFGLSLMLTCAVNLRAEPITLMPAVASMELFIMTVDEDGEYPHVLKRDTNKLTKQLNRDGYVNAIAGTQEALEEDPTLPSFLLFVQWVKDPLDSSAYKGVIITLIFMDMAGNPHRVTWYELEYQLDKTSLITQARADVTSIIRESVAIAAGQYWLKFLQARVEYHKKLANEEGQRDV